MLCDAPLQGRGGWGVGTAVTEEEVKWSDGDEEALSSGLRLAAGRR